MVCLEPDQSIEHNAPRAEMLILPTCTIDTKPSGIVRCSTIPIDSLIALASRTSRTSVIRLPRDLALPRQAEHVAELLEAIRRGELRDLDDIDAAVLSPRRRLARLREELLERGRDIAAGSDDDAELLALAFPRYPSGPIHWAMEEPR